jgi:hypothetical protein
MHAAALYEDHLHTGLFDAVVMWEAKVSMARLSTHGCLAAIWRRFGNRLYKRRKPHRTDASADPLDITTLPRRLFIFFRWKNIQFRVGRQLRGNDFLARVAVQMHHSVRHTFWKHTMRQLPGEEVASS